MEGPGEGDGDGDGDGDAGGERVWGSGLWAFVLVGKGVQLVYVCKLSFVSRGECRRARSTLEVDPDWFASVTVMLLNKHTRSKRKGHDPVLGVGVGGGSGGKAVPTLPPSDRNAL